MQITRNFTLQELTVSESYPELANQIKVSTSHLDCARLLLESVWQPIRDRFGAVVVLSFLRDDALNRAVGGSSNSDHLYGCAMDGSALASDNLEVFKWAVRNQLPYRQLIYYADEDFIHASINIPGRPFKHEALIKRNGKYESYDS